MLMQINKMDARILTIRFESKIEMNTTMDKISNRYEGELKNREGHNFPAEFVVKTDEIYKFVKDNNIKYIIAVYHFKSIQHEELHAKYYLDADYRKRIQKEWDEMDTKKREYITKFLKRLGYSDKVIVDEYQAYRYSEKPNFFGISLY
jgi:hypothetical protein